MEVITNITHTPIDDITDLLNPKSGEQANKVRDFFAPFEEENVTDLLTQPEEIDEIPDPPPPPPKGRKKEVVDEKPVIEEDVVEEEPDDIASIVTGGKKDTPPAGGDFTSTDIDKVYQELIADELIEGFSDGKPVNSLAEFKQVIQKNLKKTREQVIEEELPQFIGSLPDEVQALVTYAVEGGKDFKSMFKALAEVEEFRQIEVKENDKRTQKDVAFRYLKANKYAKGNDEEIKELIDEWEENGTLFKRTTKFKVELDEMQEQLVAQKIAEQEAKSKLAQKRVEEQRKAVKDAIISTNDLNGIKLDKTIQGKLYTGLTERQWKSVEDDREIDLLEAFIQYYKYTKPDFKILGEALFLLSDPQEYYKKRDMVAKEKADTETIRKLKSEQGRRTGGTTTNTESNKGFKREQSNNTFWNLK